MLDIDIKARREQFLNYLRQGDITIGFTKADGTDRFMTCTLLNIPEDMQPKSENPPKENENVLKVFDMDKQAWRSFRLDSVFELNVLGQPIFQTVGKPTFSDGIL